MKGLETFFPSFFLSAMGKIILVKPSIVLKTCFLGYDTDYSLRSMIADKSVEERHEKVDPGDSLLQRNVQEGSRQELVNSGTS